MRRPEKLQRSRSAIRDKELKLAERIRAYWLVRGFEVNTWLDQEGYDDGLRQFIYSVRSDMVNGLPARRVSQARK